MGTRAMLLTLSLVWRTRDEALEAPAVRSAAHVSADGGGGCWRRR